MRLEAAAIASPPARVDARWSFLATLAFVLIVVATPLGSWRILAGEGLLLAFVIGYAGVDVARLMRRWLSILALVAFLALLVARGHPSREVLGLGAVWAAIVARNGLAVMALLTLASVTPFPRLLGAFQRLGVPLVLVATFHFMYRYLHVLAEELERMVQARRSRTFHRSGRLDWGLLSNLIGVLFLRSMERGERVHAAMLARGWDGTFRSLDGDEHE